MMLLASLVSLSGFLFCRLSHGGSNLVNAGMGVMASGGAAMVSPLDVGMLPAAATEPEAPPPSPIVNVAGVRVSEGPREVLKGVVDLRSELPQNSEYPHRDLDEIHYLVVHHSASMDTMAQVVARYHSQALGWQGIGYHYLVHEDGRVEYVGDVATARANVLGRNEEVVGICLMGEFNQLPPGETQVKATANLLAELQYALGRRIPIVGHGNVSFQSTDCPGVTWPQWRGLVGG